MLRLLGLRITLQHRQAMPMGVIVAVRNSRELPYFNIHQRPNNHGKALIQWRQKMQYGSGGIKALYKQYTDDNGNWVSSTGPR